MRTPFEGIFGDTSELRVIQFLFPIKGLEFNISELARETGISRQTMVSVVKKLVKWNVLKITSRHGNANYYSINEASGFVGVFECLNNRIVEQMIGEETLAKIAIYSLERQVGIHPVEKLSCYPVKTWDEPERQKATWYHLRLDDLDIPHGDLPDVKKTEVYAGGSYAAA